MVHDVCHVEHHRSQHSFRATACVITSRHQEPLNARRAELVDAFRILHLVNLTLRLYIVGSMTDTQKEDVRRELHSLLQSNSISKDAFDHVESALEKEWGPHKGTVEPAAGTPGTRHASKNPRRCHLVTCRRTTRLEAKQSGPAMIAAASS